MPNCIRVGFLENHMITVSSSLAVGNSITQNRHSAKANAGALGLGDGLVLQPIGQQLNQDADFIDDSSADAPNFNHTVHA